VSVAGWIDIRVRVCLVFERRVLTEEVLIVIYLGRVGLMI
jgi:hypothetical protein